MPDNGIVGKKTKSTVGILCWMIFLTEIWITIKDIQRYLTRGRTG